MWIGSADLMHRNLDRRVEVLVQAARARRTSRQVARLLDLAFDATRRTPGSWAATATGRRNGGTDHLQEVLIERQRRPRVLVTLTRRARPAEVASRR